MGSRILLFTIVLLLTTLHSKYLFADAATAQHFLNNLGYNAGTVDGIWGPKSLSAIKRFYQEIGSKYDGKLDKNEISDLRDSISKVSLPTSTDIRSQDVCRGIETGLAEKAWTGIRNLNIQKHQQYENIGISITADLFGDGSLETISRMHSYKTPRPTYKNAVFYSTNKRKRLSQQTGLFFNNQQPTTKEVRKITSGDLNGDGIIDIVFFDYGEHDGDLHDGKILTLISTKNDYNWYTLKTPGELRIHTGTLIDIDGDKDLDIVFGASSKNNKEQRSIFALENDGNANFKRTKSPGVGSRLGWSWISFNASDIDGDGHHDLIMEYRKWKSKAYGTRIMWGSKNSIFDKINITDIRSRQVSSQDILMDSIPVKNGDTTDIYATYAENNYQAGTKLMRYSFSGRELISAEKIISSKFRTSPWINTIYPCKSGYKVFTMRKSNFDVKSHLAN